MAKGEVTHLHPTDPNWYTQRTYNCDDCDACAINCNGHEAHKHGQRCKYCYYAPCACETLDDRYEARRYGDE